MNEELLQMVEGMLANNATQEEVNQAVAEFQSRPEVIWKQIIQERTIDYLVWSKEC